MPTLLSRMLQSIRCLVFGQGQWRSIRHQAAVDRDGAPIPWYTYSSIEYLRNFDLTDCDVFEFGAGNSSLFWSGLTRSTTSVEDDPEWYSKVQKKARPNQQILLRQEEDDYVNSLGSMSRKFDVIIVDGKWRARCMAEAVSHLRIGGMIILDNSDWHPATCLSIRDNGFFQIDFSGPGPINGYCTTTSIFIRADCTLQGNFHPATPIGGIRHVAD
ncbi:hypothetical protein I6J77_04560 [Rhodanobacter sp. FDAARGOS 1247]|nr:hypothetical protein I6J77_04560 [Rhodanobacter sp. FDAARGOS 1247]